MNILVTGGCGFIGSNFIEHIINKKGVSKIVNADCLSYASSLDNTKSFCTNPKYLLEKYSISNYDKVYDSFYKHDITHVVHLAAESHVDNSIKGSKEFVESNIVGTHALLEAAKKFKARFHHVSTDEVYGEAGEGERFTEETAYDPRNPYSATKASSDFLVRAYVNTHKLKATISNCSNNYGPNQHEEKLIPTIIRKLQNNELIPVYGTGTNVRDWIYVKDHCKAIWKVLTKGKVGETYLVGADCEMSNLQVVIRICEALGKSHASAVRFVADRAGHDYRYAIDASKIKKDLKWEPQTSFNDGLTLTLKHYSGKFSS
jgi:dTDP-glucose 4,6-dehydratase|tara:strand:+ start:1475 stop:2425 length:951 start_codon:yes stop_codon:yes gene_type:complete